MEKKIENIKHLVKILNHYRDLYYNQNISEISDKAYDDLFDELKKLEKETGYVCSNSPTVTVGYETKSKLKKVEHNHPMLSLDKTKSIEVLEKWCKIKNCILMLKMDGLTISLRYLNGELVSAETRGNGIIGEDVLHNVKHFTNVPLNIPCKDEIIVDGEAIITYKDFEEINSKLVSDKFKNPRNLASGSVRQLSSLGVADRKLQFIAWKLVTKKSNSFCDNLMQLEKWGFTVVPYIFIKSDIPELKERLESRINYLKEKAERLSYPIDGEVLSYDDIEYGESLGRTEHHINSQIAYKFYDEKYETTLIDIEWSLGKTGTITPTAVFDEVEINGSFVSRASVHNISILKSLKLYKGDYIKVYKANDIIPQIECNISAEDRDNYLFNDIIPKQCPVCGHATEITSMNNSEILTCTNLNCKGKLLSKLSHFCSKEGMNIDGLSEATLEKLIDKGFVNDFIDIYKLKNHYNELIAMEGFGKTSVNNILDSINQSRNVSLDCFINALCIKNIGKSNSKTISKYFNEDFDKFFVALYGVYFDWTDLDDIGDVLQQNIYQFAKDFKKEDLLELAALMNFSKPKNTDNSLEGKVFVITGKLYHFKNRDEVVSEIESRGGIVAGSVSKKTDYLVNNDILSTSGKNKKAKQLNIDIITEDELLLLFKGV